MSRSSPENLRPILVISHDYAMLRKIKPEFRAYKMNLLGASHIDEIEKILEEDNPRFTFIDDQVGGFTPEDFPNKYLVSIATNVSYDKGPKIIEAGYETYLEKPVKPSHARHVVQSLDRWSSPKINYQELIEFGDILIDPSKREAYANGKQLKLTKAEFELLEFLSLNGSRVSSKNSLEKLLENGGVYGGSLRVDLSRTRIKLRGAGSKTEIVNQENLGYKLHFIDDE